MTFPISKPDDSSCNTKGQISGILWIHKIASIKTLINEEFHTIIQSSYDGPIMEERRFILSFLKSCLDNRVHYKTLLR